MNLLVKLMRVGELLQKGSREHESASKSNENGTVITERKEGT